jgi:hypothetical protein
VSAPPHGEDADTGDCTDCDRVRLEKELDAREAERIHARELDTLRQQHQAELGAAERNGLIALEKAQWDSEYELRQLFHESIADVAKGAIDRSRDSAKYVQTAAAAIAALYTGALGLVFSVTDNALPLRGVYATVFLGLAIALATAYLAFLTRPKAMPPYAGGQSLAAMQLERTAFLTRWVNSSVHKRRWAIRASVLSLAFGVAFVAAPFVSPGRPVTIPEAPAVPEVPAEIAPEIATEASALFESVAAGYEDANRSRNAAIEEASRAAEEAAASDDRYNRIASVAAALALVVVLVGPWANWRSRQDSAGRAKHGAQSRPLSRA